MILSAVIHLTPAFKAPVPMALGHKAQGWLLGEVQSYLPVLSERLHNEGGYTVSSIHRQLEGQPGSHYLRVTSLVSDLTDVLLEAVLPNIKTISFSPRDEKQRANGEELDKRPPLDFRVEGFAIDRVSHPLARLTSFAELVGEAEKNNIMDIVFASPTAFGSNGVNQPLPLPTLILNSWMEKWKKYAPAGKQFGYSFPQFAKDCILLNGLWDVHTENWNLPGSGHSLGFVGRLQMKTRSINECPEWKLVWETALRDWQALSAFSLFCGTGRYASIGMGQTSLLSSLQ